VLNSQLYKDGRGAPFEAAAQDRWLDHALAGRADATGRDDDDKAIDDDDAASVRTSGDAMSSPAHHQLRRERATRALPARWTAVLSHIPPFVHSPDEPDGYFPLPTAVRTHLLRRCARAGVTHWFAGHYHRNAGGFYVDDAPLPAAAAANANANAIEHSADRFGSVTRGRTLEVVTTAAVGGNIETDPGGDPLGLSGMRAVVASPARSGFRLMHVGPLGLKHRFVPLAATPEAPAGDDGGDGGGNDDNVLPAGEAAAFLPPSSSAVRRRGVKK
jgi:hypothetical protein